MARDAARIPDTTTLSVEGDVLHWTNEDFFISVEEAEESLCPLSFWLGYQGVLLMPNYLRKVYSLFYPNDDGFSSQEADRIQLYRLIVLSGAFLVPFVSILYRASIPNAVSPEWAYITLSVLFLSLFLVSYVSKTVRRHFVFLTWGLVYVQMLWMTAIAVLNQFGREHALAIFLTYGSIGVVIELGARSLRPVLWFLTYGFFLTAGGLFLTPAPQLGPSVVLGIMAVAGLTIVFSSQGRLATRRKLSDREKQLDVRRRKLESLYDATSQVLESSTHEEVGIQTRRVLQEVLGYPLSWVWFSGDEGALPGQTRPGEKKAWGPTPRPVSLKEDIAGRAYESGETIVARKTDAGGEALPDGLHSLVVVPVGNRGVVAVGGEEQGRSVEPFDVRLVEMLTTYTVVALRRLGREAALREAKNDAEAARGRAEEARVEAEEAARLKSAMLTNMSHEIRTPLTGIIGFAEAIGDETEGEDRVSHFAGLIKDSGQRLLDTLDGVLNLSKLEAGKVDLEAGPVHLAPQVRKVAEEFVPRAEESGLTLEVEGGEAQARANEEGLQIVLQNLLSNAIKYTEEGTVEVRTYRQNGEAVLEVEDTGIGMDPAQAESLFEPFQQASEGLAREYEGTGVGLALIRKATEQMGGAVDVDTRKGEGTCFTVRLPAAEEDGSDQRANGLVRRTAPQG